MFGYIEKGNLVYLGYDEQEASVVCEQANKKMYRLPVTIQNKKRTRRLIIKMMKG